MVLVIDDVDRENEGDLIMAAEKVTPSAIAFMVTVDACRGTTTGISAADRATTIHALVDPATRPSDLARPGHIFPLRARPGGVLARPGHTEAAVDLARLAGLAPAGVLAEVVNEDGSMARLPELRRFVAEHGLVLISIADLAEYRRRRELASEAPTAMGPRLPAPVRLPTP